MQWGSHRTPTPMRQTRTLNGEEVTVYNFIYSRVDKKPGVRGISLKRMVGAIGFEPTASWLFPALSRLAVVTSQADILNKTIERHWYCVGHVLF